MRGFSHKKDIDLILKRETSFNSGDLADKNLAKALKKDEKRKREAKDDKDKGKKKPAYRGPNRFQAGGFSQPMGWANPYQFGYGQQMPPMMQPGMQHQAMPMQNNYMPRVETRTCLNCRQAGHIARNCPQRPQFPAASAAAGSAPK